MVVAGWFLLGYGFLFFDIKLQPAVDAIPVRFSVMLGILWLLLCTTFRWIGYRGTDAMQDLGSWFAMVLVLLFSAVYVATGVSEWVWERSLTSRYLIYTCGAIVWISSFSAVVLQRLSIRSKRTKYETRLTEAKTLLLYKKTAFRVASRALIVFSLLSAVLFLVRMFVPIPLSSVLQFGAAAIASVFISLVLGKDRKAYSKLVEEFTERETYILKERASDAMNRNPSDEIEKWNERLKHHDTPSANSVNMFGISESMLQDVQAQESFKSNGFDYAEIHHSLVPLDKLNFGAKNKLNRDGTVLFEGSIIPPEGSVGNDELKLHYSADSPDSFQLDVYGTTASPSDKRFLEEALSASKIPKLIYVFRDKIWFRAVFEKPWVKESRTILFVAVLLLCLVTEGLLLAFGNTEYTQRLIFWLLVFVSFPFGMEPCRANTLFFSSVFWSALLVVGSLTGIGFATELPNWSLSKTLLSLDKNTLMVGAIWAGTFTALLVDRCWSYTSEFAHGVYTDLNARVLTRWFLAFSACAFLNFICALYQNGVAPSSGFPFYAAFGGVLLASTFGNDRKAILTGAPLLDSLMERRQQFLDNESVEKRLSAEFKEENPAHSIGKISTGSDSSPKS